MSKSLVGHVGITLDLSGIDIIQAKPKDITDRLSKSISSSSLPYSPGLSSAWVVESGLVGPSFGRPTLIHDLSGSPIEPSFARALEVSLSWKSELILLACVEQNHSVSGNDLLRFALSYGLPIFISWSRQSGKEWADTYVISRPLCTEFHEVLSPSPIVTELSPAQMCTRWTNRVRYIFHRKDSIRFTFYGGYLPRLAIQIMGPAYLSEALRGPSHMYLAHKQRIAIDVDGEWDSRDSEMYANPEEEEILQDISGYTTTGGISLWPPLHVFLRSDQWTGIWSNHNEAWFQKMWKMVEEGTLKPQPWGERNGGYKIGVGLRAQWPSERKAAAIRRTGGDLLAGWRAGGMNEFCATPIRTSGKLRLQK